MFTDELENAVYNRMLHLQLSMSGFLANVSAEVSATTHMLSCHGQLCRDKEGRAEHFVEGMRHFGPASLTGAALNKELPLSFKKKEPLEHLLGVIGTCHLLALFVVKIEICHFEVFPHV